MSVTAGWVLSYLKERWNYPAHCIRVLVCVAAKARVYTQQTNQSQIPVCYLGFDTISLRGSGVLLFQCNYLHSPCLVLLPLFLCVNRTVCLLTASSTLCTRSIGILTASHQYNELCFRDLSSTEMVVLGAPVVFQLVVTNFN